jgi:hypothetical protein
MGELDAAIHEAMRALASAASHEAARVVLAAMRLLEEREMDAERRWALLRDALERFGAGRTGP